MILVKVLPSYISITFDHRPNGRQLSRRWSATFHKKSVTLILVEFCLVIHCKNDTSSYAAHACGRQILPFGLCFLKIMTPMLRNVRSTAMQGALCKQLYINMYYLCVWNSCFQLLVLAFCMIKFTSINSHQLEFI